jgi:hypothetical protein
MKNRITGSNHEDALRGKLVHSVVQTESLHTRIFHFGQVISNTDSRNLGRIKVRIPLVDDIYYNNGTKEEGDELLPFCLPISHRFFEVPEVNSIVMVAIFDAKTPYFGRLYFDTFTELSTSDIFSRPTPEINSLSDWENVERAFNVKLGTVPKPNAFDGKDNVIYPMGIRGKGKNKFVLLKEESHWIQNEGTSSESSIKLSKNVAVASSDEISILSAKGSNEHYHPVFHKPTHEYFASINSMLQKIVMLLNSIPALSPSGPCMPAPKAANLISELQKMAKNFQKYRNIGHSKKITIN